MVLRDVKNNIYCTTLLRLIEDKTFKLTFEAVPNRLWDRFNDYRIRDRIRDGRIRDRISEMVGSETGSEMVGSGTGSEII